MEYATANISISPRIKESQRPISSRESVNRLIEERSKQIEVQEKLNELIRGNDCSRERAEEESNLCRLYGRFLNQNRGNEREIVCGVTGGRLEKNSYSNSLSYSNSPKSSSHCDRRQISRHQGTHTEDIYNKGNIREENMNEPYEEYEEHGEHGRSTRNMLLRSMGMDDGSLVLPSYGHNNQPVLPSCFYFKANNQNNYNQQYNERGNRATGSPASKCWRSIIPPKRTRGTRLTRSTPPSPQRTAPVITQAPPHIGPNESYPQTPSIYSPSPIDSISPQSLLLSCLKRMTWDFANNCYINEHPQPPLPSLLHCRSPHQRNNYWQVHKNLNLEKIRDKVDMDYHRTCPFSPTFYAKKTQGNNNKGKGKGGYGGYDDITSPSYCH